MKRSRDGRPTRKRLSHAILELAKSRVNLSELSARLVGRQHRL